MLGGTMPEDLPTPNKSIAQIEKERIKAKSQEKNAYVGWVRAALTGQRELDKGVSKGDGVPNP